MELSRIQVDVAWLLTEQEACVTLADIENPNAADSEAKIYETSSSLLELR